MDTIRIRKNALLGGSALAVALFASSGAWAQNCVVDPALANIGGLPQLTAFGASVSSSVAATIANVSTAFLANQTSAFVSNPGGAGPNEQGGGVWARGVGGEVTIKSQSGTAAALNVPAPFAAFSVAGNVNCSSKQHETFAGVQVGTDVARLNLDGWNFNMGFTAGYLEARSREQNGLPPFFRTNFEVPFIGAYAVATKGGFFADLNVRGEFYNIELPNPGFNFFNQQYGAKGISLSTSMGYQWALANNWFIEPSVGFIFSRTQIDPFNAVGAGAAAGLSGTFSTANIDSEMGRASVRVGTSFNTGSLILQPFVSASVFHEFAGPTDSGYQTCVNCVFLNPQGVAVSVTTQTSTTRIGTYGQFSAGLAGQVVGTGWVGFVRGDYRTGDNIEGWTANAGLRYNFLPAAVPPVITKGPVVPPIVTVVNWTGFYVGGFLGADWGATRFGFFNDGYTVPRIQGIIGGGQVGYNWQIGRVVLGVEGDVGATNKQGTRFCGGANGLNGFGFNPGVFSPFFLTCQDNMDWVATAAVRVGFTIDRALLYVKAGGAWTEEKVAIGCILGPLNPILDTGLVVRGCVNQAGLLTNGSTASNDRTGGLVGVGSEFALTPYWSAKAEYNYIDFGRDTVRTTDGTILRLDTHINEVKIGVNYHFSPMSMR
jgi:opacity protein-like surface antigen